MSALRSGALALLTLALPLAACDDDDDDPIAPETLTCNATLGAAPGVTTGATGTATFTITGTQIAWTATSSNLADVTAAHIHRRSNASIVIPGTGNTGAFTLSATGSGSGTITGLTDAQITEIETADTYFNIHTTANPPGEIQGDLVCN